MFNLIIILILISSVLLVLVILAQNSKGGGLSSQFGGSGASNMIGVKRTGDLLEKLTWGFAIALMVLSLSTTFIKPERRAIDDVLQKTESPVTPNFNMPTDGVQLEDADGGAAPDTEDEN
jgi:preprotein translocase subunit SecG